MHRSAAYFYSKLSRIYPACRIRLILHANITIHSTRHNKAVPDCQYMHAHRGKGRCWALLCEPDVPLHGHHLSNERQTCCTVMWLLLLITQANPGRRMSVQRSKRPPPWLSAAPLGDSRSGVVLRNRLLDGVFNRCTPLLCSVSAARACSSPGHTYTHARARTITTHR